MRASLTLLLLPLLCSGAAPAAGEATERSVTTTGEATVYVVPDEVILSLGVDTFNQRLDEAKAANDAASSKLIKTIKAAGVEDRHVQTDVLQVEIKYNGNRAAEGIEGYYARRAYSVTLKDPKKLESLLDAALKNGANEVDGISYQTKELRKYRDQARVMAIKAAKEKAELLAKELNCGVGTPSQIREGGGGMGYWGGRFRGQNVSQNAMQEDPVDGDESGGTTPMGQIGVSASVTVTFDLSPR
ncbi:MAG TPA: SIMPL domain-containing protein [Tepidisphaeraceae bacterium]|nr:SIMPL domain-containing protein [Tepidisphaeraceae bacterium]